MKPLPYFGKYAVLLILIACCGCVVTRPAIIDTHASYKPIDSTTVADAGMAAFLAPYKTRMDSVMSEVVGHSDMPLSKAQPESTLGNFMADAILLYSRQQYPGVQLAVLNYGGIRLPYLPAGAITKAEVFEIMPFDNMLTLVEIPGKVLRQFCNQMAQYGGWPVSGITFQISNKEAIDIQVDNAPISDQLIYTAVLPDYVANGGDNCAFLATCKKQYLKVLTRDVLLGYIKGLEAKKQALHVNLDKRISYAP